MLKINESSTGILEDLLREKIQNHLQNLGISKSKNGRLETNGNDKDTIRTLHRIQREDRIKSNTDFISKQSDNLLKHFASGVEVVPELISPKLERVFAGTWQAELFRFATLTWSVPVSRGYGRRLRFLVWDSSNNKLIGLIALGDPVFNLSVRDKHIGWNLEERSFRLINIMDAYVLGALPPYNFLLGGKMIACLVRSLEIYNEFFHTYGNRIGVISKKNKKAQLLAVTTSSSMGRSSVYNRLKLNNIQYFKSIGYTQGWGHFHIPDDIFFEMREYLRRIDHKFADYYRFGQGSNWRLNATRVALHTLGLEKNLLRHGVNREVFYCELASNANSILRSGRGRPEKATLLKVNQIANQSLERWVLPRSMRRPEFRKWENTEILNLLKLSHENI